MYRTDRHCLCGAKPVRFLESAEEIVVSCSGNIIKNVKAVIVPTTGDLKGIETSAILGAVGGKQRRSWKLLVDVTDEDL